MTAKIDNLNGFKAKAAIRKAAEDPRIEEIEGWGMDEGRVFIHLAPGFCYDSDAGSHDENQHLRSVGSASELRSVLKAIVEEKAHATQG